VGGQGAVEKHQGPGPATDANAKAQTKPAPSGEPTKK